MTSKFMISKIPNTSITSDILLKALLPFVVVSIVAFSIMFSTITVSGKGNDEVTTGIQNTSFVVEKTPLNVAHSVNASFDF